MAPHADDPSIKDDEVDRLPPPTRPEFSANPPRILIIGAGSRGDAYAAAVERSTNGIVVAVAEPIAYKRRRFGEKYIWKTTKPSDGQEFADWKDYVKWEIERRAQAAKGEEVPGGIDAVFICVLDEQHKDVILGLAPLGLHIMCEKPLATTLEDCVAIYKALLPGLPGNTTPQRIFSIGHVLRYSPHNMLLRKLLLEDRVIGEIMSINHTEPVGWWHFTHSYVRGNWRKESTTAPSLLTKSCHDIDLLLWLLCSPPSSTPSLPPHLPSLISSTGSLQYFNPSHKPLAAGNATNCLSCPISESCKYSAPKIYIEGAHKGLGSGNTKWPVMIVVPEIEECISSSGLSGGIAALTAKLEEDYTSSTPKEEIDKKNWFGRCVYESSNDVCDEQVVTLTFAADPLPTSLLPHQTPNRELALRGRGPKTAIFHMVAHTDRICKRYTHIYGSDGEIYADSSTITVTSFLPDPNYPTSQTLTSLPSTSPPSNNTKTYRPHLYGGGHGGGDDGLARAFILAVDAVKNHNTPIAEAQEKYVGCTLEEVVRSHALVFAAESARRGEKVVRWGEWWAECVGEKLGGGGEKVV